jgi:hypothetical protein
MRIAKKITGVLTAMVCAAGAVCGGSSLIADAETYGEQAGYGDYLYYQTVDEDEDGTYDYVEITDCDESAVEVDIPSEIEGLPVETIAESAFDGCYDLKSVKISESVTFITWYTFTGCQSLTNIEISEDNNYYCSVDGVLFSKDKTSLIKYPPAKTDSEYDIPDSVSSIESFAFVLCINLKSVTIPGSVSSTGYEVFRYSSSLKSVTIRDGLKIIESGLFYGCTSLESITIPDSVTSIGRGAFNSCTSLESITIENPECDIYDDVYTISNCEDENYYPYFNGTIYGYTNSTAQAYAEEYGYDFVSIGEYSPETIPGDISGNGKIDLYDAIEICKSIMGMRTFTDEEQAIADYDGNGKVDLYDAIGIAKKLLEK